MALYRILAKDHHKADSRADRARRRDVVGDALAQQKWLEARDRSDFGHFAPALERVLELQQRYIACFDGTGEFAHPYDVLLDDYEPGLTTAELTTLFETLQRELVPLVSAAAAAGEDGRVFPGHYPLERQKPFADELLRAVGYVPDNWRLDAAVHPFARSMAPTDVRMTTRWEPDDLAMAVYSCLHEFGHGLYEAQIRPDYYRTPLADDAGLGVHESQSRLWENLVGRSRPFCEWVLPLYASHLERPVRGDGRVQLYRAVNQVRLSLIRIEADETTYNLHIAMRFELELALVEGRLVGARAARRLERGTHRLLGLEVPSSTRASCRTSTGAPG